MAAPSSPTAPGKHPAPLAVALDTGALHGHRTGVGTAVGELSEALRARPDIKLKPYLISGRATPLPDERRLPLPGVVASHLWSRISWPKADRWLGDVDVVHGPNFVAPPSDHPTVVTVHDCWFLEHPDRAQPVVTRAGRWMRRSIERGAWVHAASHATAEQAARHFDTDRIRVAHLGPPPRIACDAVRPTGLDGVNPDVIAIGTEERRKGYPDLVAAFAKIAADRPELGLVIAGSPGDDNEALSAAIDELSPAIGIRVARLGIISDAEKAWLLGNARVLAYPSLDEGFGFPLLEANLARLPIVARAAGSIPEVAGSTACLVPGTGSKFVDDYADAMAEALEDTDLRLRLINAAAANLDRFSWERCADQLTQLYHTARGDIST